MKARAIIRQMVSIGLVLSLIGWVVRGIVTEASGHDWAALRPSPLLIFAASALLVAAYLIRSSLWAHLVRGMGQSIGTVDGWRVSMGSQLGRYLPGKLWQFVGAGILAKDYGVSPSASAVAALVGVLLHLLVGGALALLVLWRVADDLWLAAGLALAAVVTGLALVASPLLPWSLKRLGRMTGQPGLGEFEPPPPRLLLAVVPGYFAVWLAFAGALMLVTHGLFPSLPWLSPADAIGAMAAAVVIGFAVLVAPSGLGVREAMLMTLLEPAVGVVVAGVVAIGLRIVMTGTELSLSLWGAWPYLRRRLLSQKPQLEPTRRQGHKGRHAPKVKEPASPNG